MRRSVTLPALALGLALPLAAVPAAAQDWSGPYVGVHMGYADLDEDGGETVDFDTDLDGTYGDTVFTSGGADAFSPGFCDGAALNPTASAGCQEDSGGIDVGLRAGYDWQFGQIVAGLVGEVAYSDLEDQVTAFSTTPAYYTFSREAELSAALRARLGWAAGDNLFYATGGAVAARINNGFTTSNGVNSFTESSDEDDTAYGWQAGAGYERAVGSGLRLGLEYLYTDLEADDYTIRAGGPAPATNPFILVNADGTDLRRTSDSLSSHAVRFTVSYGF